MGPHVDSVISSIDSNAASLLNQLQQLSLQSSSTTQTMSYVSSPSQPLVVNIVHSSNPKGNQQSDGKKKGRGKKKFKGGRGNANKPNDDTSEGKKESKDKLKFPCKLCSGDHLTHLFPKIQDVECLLDNKVLLVPMLCFQTLFHKGKKLFAITNSKSGIPSGGN